MYYIDNKAHQTLQYELYIRYTITINNFLAAVVGRKTSYYSVVPHIVGVEAK